MKKLILSISVCLISTIIFIPYTSALANNSTNNTTIQNHNISIQQKEEAQQLANKIKQSSPNSKITTINNNGKLIDVSKNNEGKVFVTAHNNDKLLFNNNEISANSCEF